MENELSRVLSAAEAKVQYDAQVKKVLSQKVILAWILRGTVEGFGGMEIDEIIPYIEGEPEIASIPVNPGEVKTEQVSGMPNEDKVPNEGTIYYDIRFFANRPDKKGKVRILVNLEAQKDFWPGYRIETRGIYYAARMISAQLGTEFSTPHYNGIKKVVSIWLCMNAGKKSGNAISEYSIRKKDIVKGIPDVPEAYDKISVVLITLDAKKETDEKLLQMLNVLLSSGLKSEEKKQKLEEGFGINFKGNAGKEVSLMCNLSEYVEEQGIEKGYGLGAKDEKIETAKRMIKGNKLDYADIASFTELPEETVRKLAKEMSA